MLWPPNGQAGCCWARWLQLRLGRLRLHSQGIWSNPFLQRALNLVEDQLVGGCVVGRRGQIELALACGQQWHYRADSLANA